MSVENIQPASYVVFKDKDNVYKAKNTSGIVEFFGPHVNHAIGQALQSMSGTSSPVHGGTIHVNAGSYVLGAATFSGFDVPEFCTVEMEEGTFLEIPSGFSGYVFRIVDHSGLARAGTDMHIRGGWLREAGPTSHNWVGVRIQSQTLNGVFACTVSNMVVQDAKTAIEFYNSASGGYINGVNIYNINPSNCINGVDFINSGGAPFNRNLLVGIYGQAGADSAYGFKNIGPGIDNHLIESKVWDMHLGSGGNAITANIVSGANYTKIDRGIVDALNFTDSGQNTYIDTDVSGLRIDYPVRFGSTLDVSGVIQTRTAIMILNNAAQIRVSGTAAVPSFTQMASGGNETVYLVPGAGSGANSSISLWSNSTQDKRFFLQQSYFNSIFNSLRQAAGGTPPLMLFQMQDVVNGTTLEPMRFDASGHVIFNQSGANAGAGVKFRGHIAFESGASGISFSGMQMLPTMSVDAKYVIWVSGATTRALRTADGVVEYSGGSGFASTVIQGALDSTYSGFGGKVQLREGLFDLAGSGLNFNTSRSGRVELGGVLDATILAYAGVTYSGNAAITISGAATTTPNDTFYLHDLCINCGTVTSGRNAIDVLQAGIGYIERIRINNADIGIDYFDSNGVWTRDIHVRTGFVGLRTRGGPVTNANAMFFDGLECVDMSQAGAIMNADNAKSAFAGAITNSDFELNSGAYGVVFDGGITNFKIDSCYFENNTSGDIYLKGQSGGGFKPSNTTIVNCRFSNSNSVTSGVGGAIVIDFAAKTVIDNCQFFQRVSGCAILFNASGFSALDKIFVRNPTLSSVPYLIDNTYGLGTARNFGTVEEDSRRGVIIMNGSAACVEGDVVQAGGGNNLFATTTTSGVIGPAAVMYGNSAANKPCVIATDGISPVLTISGTVRGELLGSSTTTKAAAVMSGVQVNQCIGWSVEGFLSGVKVNCKIL